MEICPVRVLFYVFREAVGDMCCGVMFAAQKCAVRSR